MSQQSQTLNQKFKTLQAEMTNKSNEDLSKVHKSVILAHLINTEFGLSCIDRNGASIPFPQDWRKENEGVYKFNYRLKGTTSSQVEKTVQFQFIDNQTENGSISVNYSFLNTDVLNQYELAFDQNKIDDISKAYRKNLEDKLNVKKVDTPASNNPTNLQPVWREPFYNQPPVNPHPLYVPNKNQPFEMPYNGGEYVGPNHELFQGRGPNNPIGQNPINPMNRPPGSRYDPIDPFGTQGMDENPDGPDFRGFNQFGKPFGGQGNGGGFNPGKFL